MFFCIDQIQKLPQISGRARSGDTNPQRRHNWRDLSNLFIVVANSMDKENCNICHKASRSPLVNCAVCKYPYHMKCVAPNSTIKDFDGLLSTPGFYFYCKNHHNLSVHKLLKRISSIEEKFKKCFSEVNDELASFQESLQSCELENMPFEKISISNTNDSPLTTTKSHINGKAKRKSSEEVSDDPPKRSKDASLVTEKQILSPSLPIVIVSSQQTTTNVIAEPTSPTYQQTSLPSTSSNTHSIGVASQANSNLELSNQLENNLFALPKRRRVFLSHLPVETSEKAIENHLRKINIPVDQVSIEKFKFKTPRRYSSFVINVENDGTFQHLLNPSNWPVGTIVHEYNTRSDFQNNQRRRQL